MKTLICISFFVASTVAWSSDSLFSKMEGRWRGDGVRHSVLSNADTPIHIDVDSEIRGDFLVSRNTVTEEGRTYTRVYWLRAKPNMPGVYEMGDGETPDARVLATGNFEENIFSVQQSLTSNMVLRSKTEFGSKKILYSEKGYRDRSLLFETFIIYIRNTDG